MFIPQSGLVGERYRVSETEVGAFREEVLVDRRDHGVVLFGVDLQMESWIPESLWRLDAVKPDNIRPKIDMWTHVFEENVASPECLGGSKGTSVVYRNLGFPGAGGRQCVEQVIRIPGSYLLMLRQQFR